MRLAPAERSFRLDQQLKQRWRGLKIDSMLRHIRMHSRTSGASAVVSVIAFTACARVEAPPISYPCKNPDPRHLGPDGEPDPCHFEDPDSPAQAAKKFFGAVAGPFCEALYSCCTDPVFLQDFAGGTLESCKTTWAAGGGLGSKTLLALKASLVNKTTVFDDTQLDACVARLNARLMPPPDGGAACMEPVPFILLNTCFGAAFQGQLAPGDACVMWPSAPEDLSFAECQGGRCEKGRCAAFLKSGDTCTLFAYSFDPPDTICNFVQGEWCEGMGVTGTCGARPEIGAACDGDGAGYECKSLNCMHKVCQPLLPTSAACYVF